jgi:zinc protease
VARKYFHPDNLSLVGYLPDGEGAGVLDQPEARSAVEKVLGRDGGVRDMSTGKFTTVAPRPDDAADLVTVGGVADRSAVETFGLDNGVRVLVKRRSTVPVVSVLSVFQGGSRLEPPGKSGLATLAHRVLTKGTANLSAEEVVGRVEGAGGSIDSYANFDTGGIYVNVLSEYIDEVLPVYREVVRLPSFQPDRVEQERDKLLEEIAKRRDNPVQLAIDGLFNGLFGAHPYSHPFAGDPEEVARLDSGDCKTWFDRVLVPGNIVLAFAGDITVDKAREIAESLYGDLPAGRPPSPASEAPGQPVSPGRHEMERKDLKQAVTLVGYIAPPMMTDDAVALEVLNGVLTGLGGRLFVELRDKRSLGYMTGSALSTYLERSVFFGYANPGPEGAEEAFRVILHELDRVTAEEVSDDELTRSKEWLVGSQIMQLQRNFAQAIAYGSYEVLGFGWQAVDRTPELIQRVSKSEVKEAAARLFHSDRAVLVRLFPE